MYTVIYKWKKLQMNPDASAFTPFGSPSAMASGLWNFMIWIYLNDAWLPSDCYISTKIHTYLLRKVSSRREDGCSLASARFKSKFISNVLRFDSDWASGRCWSKQVEKWSWSWLFAATSKQCRTKTAALHTWFLTAVIQMSAKLLTATDSRDRKAAQKMLDAWGKCFSRPMMC